MILKASPRWAARRIVRELCATFFAHCEDEQTFTSLCFDPDRSDLATLQTNRVLPPRILTKVFYSLQVLLN